MRMMSVPDAADALGVSAYSLRKAIRDGKLPVIPVGKRVLVDVDAAREIAATRQQGVRIAELAEQTGMTITAIRRGIAEGWLPYTRVGRTFVFDVPTVEEALGRRTTTYARK